MDLLHSKLQEMNANLYMKIVIIMGLQDAKQVPTLLNRPNKTSRNPILNIVIIIKVKSKELKCSIKLLIV